VTNWLELTWEFLESEKLEEDHLWGLEKCGSYERADQALSHTFGTTGKHGRFASANR